MRVNGLDLPDDAKKKILEKGIEKLTPPQVDAVKKGVLNFKNLVVAAPTASGKTLIAEMAFLKMILENRKKAIYIVPLRALAYEKFQDFKRYEDIGIKVAMSVGDYDSSDNWLANYDLIIVTSEKLDSLLRHNPIWLREIGLVISDEIHLLNDEGRGPTLEVVLTKLKMDVNPQIIGLSATISNAQEIAEWLDSELVVSDYRPIKLYEGVYDGEVVRFLEKKDEYIHESQEGLEGEILLALDTIKKGKQALIFLSTRRSAESLASKLERFTKNLLTEDERKKLKKLSENILTVLSHPTKQCKKLSSCVKGGVAFHHAGLPHGQRSLIEEYFRKGLIKVICATPTLAAGVDLPAFRVLIRDAKRYYSNYGYVYIPVLEYQQMAGRAGRPRYDSYGESILIAKSERESEELFNRFVLGEPEEIYSKLSVEPVLRTHVLSLINTTVRNEEQLKKFFSNTFFAYQFEDISRIEEILDRIIDRLEEQKFIKRDGNLLQPTRLGKRVSELYLDPESAYKLLNGMRVFKTGFDLLLLISSLMEISPLSVRKKDLEIMEEEILKRRDDITFEIPEEWDLEYDNFLKAFKTALVFEEWINERGENYLLDKYGITPGELNSKREIADWLLYSCEELGNLIGLREKIKIARKLRTRIKYGVKEELLNLVKLRGIGRVKARILYDAGFRRLSDLKRAPKERLGDLIGPKTAESVMKQILGEDKQKTL
ncbi:MAG: DEAD/DEAH box helicase [Candidatus Aenigmarchaeota archaeon]|nr:DEAD/DEAH box helicase [Candidatus Aenigmarchaeota archaeon]